MILDLINALRAAGIQVPDGAAEVVEASIRHQYGGERVYIARHPKRQHAVRLARLECTTQREVATLVGLSVRQVRRVQRGR